jgi:hypothetical protein
VLLALPTQYGYGGYGKSEKCSHPFHVPNWSNQKWLNKEFLKGMGKYILFLVWSVIKWVYHITLGNVLEGC